MFAKTVVVGVDSSLESAHAARMGDLIASQMAGRLRLVHGVTPTWMTVSPPDIGGAVVAGLAGENLAGARELVQLGLAAAAGERLAKAIEVAPGSGTDAVLQYAREHDATLIVLGGKKHEGWERLLGSTVTGVLRRSEIPLFVTQRTTSSITRILVAVDDSPATGPTIRMAERWARLFGSSLHLLHVDEAMPTSGQGMPRDEAAYQASWDRVRRNIIPYVSLAGTRVTLRPGHSAEVIATEAVQWKADLVILGSHGKGFIDRLLLGSTSEQLLRLMPTNVLIVPTLLPAPRPEAAWLHAAAAS